MNLPDDKTVHGHYLEWLCVKGWERRKIGERSESLARRNGVGKQATDVVTPGDVVYLLPASGGNASPPRLSPRARNICTRASSM